MSERDTARRLFIAVMLPDDVQERLAATARALDAHHAILKPVRPEALHFTLRFLGNTTAAQEQAVIEACSAATAGCPSFPLHIGGFGAFPNTQHPRVVWLGLRAGAEPLMALQRRVQDELLRHRIIARGEDFVPHLTLARVRQEARPSERRALGAAIARLPDSIQARCRATALSLVHSTLTPQGSRYTVRQEWPLAGESGAADASHQPGSA